MEAASYRARKVMADSDILIRLRSFLDAEEPQLMNWLVSVWNRQQNSITYAELREAILSGQLTVQQLEKWQRDYAKFVNERLAPAWARAFTAGAANTDTAIYNPFTSAMGEFIQRRGAELVTNMTAEQRNAIRAMTYHAAYHNNLSVDSLARAIRPVIGLTRPQATANLNYYAGQLDAFLEAGMTQARAESRAREAAAKYAGRQHRYRAQNIARTELAYAYNQGSYGGTRDARLQGFIGDCAKTWLTADDERVCPTCGSIEGETVNMDAMFSIGVLLPPAHPSCRCAVAYNQVAEPVIPQGPDIQDLATEETPEPTPEYLEGWGVDNIQLAGTDETAVRGILEEMDKVFDSSPELRGIIDNIEYTGMGTPAGVELDERGISLLLGSDFEDVDRLNSWYTYNQSSFAEGTTWRDIGSHEAGHVLTAELIRREYPDLRVAHEVFNNDTYADQLVKAALDESRYTDAERIKAFRKYLGPDGDSDTDEELLGYYNRNKSEERLMELKLSGISKYAKNNSSETIAEAFSDVKRNRDNADVSSLKIVEEVMTRLRQ